MEVAFDQMNEGYEKSLRTLDKALMMSKASTDGNYKESMNQLVKALDELKFDLAIIRQYVISEKEQLSSLEKLKVQSTALLDQIKYAIANVPSKISQQKRASSPIAKTDNVVTTEAASFPASQIPKIGCTFLDFLTVEEFQNVPKYMKGRLTYEKVNSVIDQVDRVYTEKYKIYKSKKSSLNDVSRKRFEAFRLQESTDTKGVHFIVEQDIHEFSSLKMDSAMRSIITILRHCGLIYEIRGGGYTRFASHLR